MSDFSDTLKLFPTFVQPLFIATLEMFEKCTKHMSIVVFIGKI